MKIGLPGKSILKDYFEEKRTSRRPFPLLRIRFPGRPILYNWSLVEGYVEVALVEGHAVGRAGLAAVRVRGVEHLHWRRGAHVPQPHQAVPGRAADEGHVVVRAEAVDGFV